MDWGLRRSIMFHVRRRPADYSHRKRKKKPGVLTNNHQANTNNDTNSSSSQRRNSRSDTNNPFLIELNPDGTSDQNSQVFHLTSNVMEIGSLNGVDIQIYRPNIQPRHCVIANTDGLTSVTPCHSDAYVYINNQRIFQTTILKHGNVVSFGNSNGYLFVDPLAHETNRYNNRYNLNVNNSVTTSSNTALITENLSIYERSYRAQSPVETVIIRDNPDENYDADVNIETTSNASIKDGNRSIDSFSEKNNPPNTNRNGSIGRLSHGQDPILPAVLEFPEDNQEQFLARIITHLDVSLPTFKLAPAYALYLCARYRASTHYRPELTSMERAHKLTMFLQHAVFLIRKAVIEQQNESVNQAFWLANATELLHFLKSDRHISAFSIQAQELLAETFHLSFQNLVSCICNELNIALLTSFLSDTIDEHPIQLIMVFNSAMNLLRKCRINAQLIVQVFSQLFHWISVRALSTIINNPHLCTRSFGQKLFIRLRNLQDWADTQGLILAAECHFAKIVQCAHLLQSPKSTVEELANLSAACFKLNSLQLRALLGQYKAESNEQIASVNLLEQTARAAESVADELLRTDNHEVKLHDDPNLPVQLWLPEDGFTCDAVQGIPQGLAEFIQPLQMAGYCRLSEQPTSSGHWTVYMSVPRSPSSLNNSQPEVHIIRLQKSNGGMGLSIVAAKGAGQERLGIYIKSVVPGGAADLDGRLAAGDQLLFVDGHSLIGITQEKAAELLVRTGNLVTLQVAKGGAVYHGLATLLQQPSPTPNRGPRSLSERDLRAKLDNQSITSNSLQHDIYNPGYSRTSSSNSINIAPNVAGVQNGILPNLIKTTSRSAYNLNQQTTQQNHNQDTSFYQNVGIIRNQFSNPVVSKASNSNQFDERIMRNGQQVLAAPQQKISNYYTNSLNKQQSQVNNASMTNLIKGPTINHSSVNIPDEQRAQFSVKLPNSNDEYLGNLYKIQQKQPQPQQPQPQSHSQPQPQVQSIQQQQYTSQVLLQQPQSQPPQQNFHSMSNLLNKSTDSLVRRPQPQLKPQSHPMKLDNISVRSFSSATSVANSLRMQQNNGFGSNRNSQNEETLMKQSKSDDYLRRYHQSVNRLNFTNSPNMSNQYILEDKPHLRPSQYSSVTDQQITQLKNEMQNLYTSEEMLLMQQQQQQQQQQPQQQQQLRYQQQQQQQIFRSQAKLAEMSEEVKRRQNRQQNQHQQQMLQQQQYHFRNSVAKMPTIVQQQLVPQQSESIANQVLSSSVHDVQKGVGYLSGQNTSNLNKLSISNPWDREEREKENELKRLHARQWRDQQIHELANLSNRNSQQEEHLLALKLEREFERRAQESASEPFDDEDIDDVIRETDSDNNGNRRASSSNNNGANVEGGDGGLEKNTIDKLDPKLKTILKDEQQHNESNNDIIAPPSPPERGSSFNIMNSLRSKDFPKKIVSFNETPSAAIVQQTNQMLNLTTPTLRENANQFIEEAEQLLAQPQTPPYQADSTNTTQIVTPGVIGAQEVYKDPRLRRLEEQKAAQRKNAGDDPVPEKLSFKEKILMFNLEVPTEY